MTLSKAVVQEPPGVRVRAGAGQVCGHIGSYVLSILGKLRFMSPYEVKIRDSEPEDISTLPPTNPALDIKGGMKEGEQRGGC